MDDSTAGSAEAYYKVAEAAVLLSVAPSTVYALIAAGDLTAIRVGRSLRIAPEAVDAYLGRKATSGADGDEMLTIGDVASKLKIGKRTVEKLIASGELESAKVASMRRISLGALEQYLKAVSTAGTP
jgi:excisionase family DNA binding protein